MGVLWLFGTLVAAHEVYCTGYTRARAPGHRSTTTGARARFHPSGSPLTTLPRMKFETDVAIIGGGVAGLTAAWQLAAAGQRVTLFEARPRLGGRVMTASVAPLADVPWVDLGPAWFWPHQPHIRALIAQMGVPVFEQHHAGLAMYEAGDGRAPDAFDASGQTGLSYRVAGGMAALTQALQLATQAAPQPVSIRLDHAVRTLRLQHDHVVVEGEGFRGTAGRIIVAAPPRVVARDLVFAPPLADTVRERLHSTVTWMGHAMKCVATYDTPFWRHAGRSGHAVSWGGPLQEIHDACTPALAHAPAGYALMGFVAPRTTPAMRAFREAGPDERRTAVLAQLARLFGDDALCGTGYAEYDWARDPLTRGPHDDVPPGAHPAYNDAPAAGAPAGDSWAGRLTWAGAEHSAAGGGYLDGAVASGWRAATAILAPRTTV